MCVCQYTYVRSIILGLFVIKKYYVLKSSIVEILNSIYLPVSEYSNHTFIFIYLLYIGYCCGYGRTCKINRTDDRDVYFNTVLNFQQ